jgi:hypothetical protein
MDNIKFDFVFLGQSVLKYQVPLTVFNEIVSTYQSRVKELPPANKQLVGKIKSEHSLFFDGKPNNLMKPHNFLSQEVLMWFKKTFHHYLTWNKVRNFDMHLNSIWVNSMKDNEYNPVHIHIGSEQTGLSSVMILKSPKTTGVEYSAETKPMNGQLQIIGNSAGQFAKTDYSPPMEVRDFYVFPYDMRHCVYPFNSSNDIRVTLACNCDVLYNQIESRGVS